MAIYKRNIKQASKEAAASTGNNLTREEELQALLRMCSPEELSRFIVDYSKVQPDIQNRLRDFMLPSVDDKEYPDYFEGIEQLFTEEMKALDYFDLKDPGRLTFLMEELGRWIWKAERYTERMQFKEAVDISRAVMEHIAICIDDIHDHDRELIFVCNEAESVVEKVIRSDIPSTLLQYIVNRLKVFQEEDIFEVYGLADIDFLLMLAEIKTADTDKALQLLSSAIKEESNPSRCTEMVKVMLQILQNEGRTDEYRKTVAKYQFLPDIMKLRYEWLEEKGDWEGILKMLDEVMRVAERDQRLGHVIDIKEDKLQVYQRMNASDKIIELSTDLFFSGREPMVKYRLLKKHVSAEKWPDFSDQLLTDSRNYPWRDVNAEIFIEEKKWDKLMDWVLENTRLSSQHDDAEPYDKYLVKHCPDRFLEMYRVRLSNYPLNHMGRAHYRFMVAIMQRLQTYPGGKAVVRNLVELYRVYYRNRPALMDELNQKYKN